MKHVICEFISQTSYRLIVDGKVLVFHCKLQFIPGSKTNEAINPTHNEAWAKMLELANG